MFSMKEHLMVDSLEEGYDLLIKNKNNIILGGSSFLRLGNKNINLGIDLSNLDLDYIREDEENIEIGPMTTLRTLETNSILKTNFNGVVSRSVEEIVGIQLRAVATIGGTVGSKYGFSDLITALMTLDTYVELYKGGIISLEEHMSREKVEKDIVVKIIIKKDNRKSYFTAMRNSKSDYAILNCGVSKTENNYKIVVGARPGRAITNIIANDELLDNNLKEKINELIEKIKFGTNMRGSKEYRKLIAKVLVERAIKKLEIL
ncbi:MAG: FAD binding domain-containing protein [Psychrilyobacter sp.]|nr:FAD binding domain-containing protein [Psychrilyobacter sp.]